jgi:hypothetical protein
MRPILLLTIIASTCGSWAHGETDTKDAESKVEISIYDLARKNHGHVHHAKPKSVLSLAYVEAIIQKVKDSRAEILKCLPENSAVQSQVTVSPHPTGSADVRLQENSDPATTDCIVNALKMIQYPAHAYSENPEISFPLRLNRKTL